MNAFVIGTAMDMIHLATQNSNLYYITYTATEYSKTCEKALQYCLEQNYMVATHIKDWYKVTDAGITANQEYTEETEKMFAELYKRHLPNRNS